MNLPRYLIDFFSQHFTAYQVQVLNANWQTYSQLSLANSSREQLLAEAEAVLRLTETV